MIIFPVLLIFACTVSAQQNKNGPSDGLTVQTQQGPVIGTLPVPGVRQFLGVPYAVANRWEAPSSPLNRSAVFNASSFGDSCPQQLNTDFLEVYRIIWGGLSDDEIFVSESEDCLNINIWAPSVERAQESTAVLVWIYGGSFSYGTSNTPQYHGLNMVQDNEDITVVSFNYRVNIFGQPNAPQLNGTEQAQNFGLLDADAAIQWVYENIESFGGDPERIVIYGQSAGAALVDAYTFSHPNDTIVKGLIEQSGSVLAAGNTQTFPTNGQNLDDTAWIEVASALGCGDTTDSTQFSCMKNVSTSDLTTAVSNTTSAFTLVYDDVTIFSDTLARSASGNFLQVPVLSGTTTNEGDIFILVAELAAIGVTIQPTLDILSSIYTMGISCAAAETLQYRVAAGVTAFRYEYQAIFPNLSPIPQLRAYHISDVPLVFGTYDLSSAPTHTPSTPTEVALSKAVQGAWVAFARDPENGLPSIGWPEYHPELGSTIAAVGNHGNETGWTFIESWVIDALCSNMTVLEGVSEQVVMLFEALI